MDRLTEGNYLAFTESDNRNDDDACGKLWEIYVKEAQQHDEGMVKSWKEDMDSILVFVSLILVLYISMISHLSVWPIFCNFDRIRD